MGVGGKWEQFCRKKAVNALQKLQSIQEVDKKEEDTPTIGKITVHKDGHENKADNSGKSIKDIEEIAGEVKLLVMKQKEVTKEEDDQDIVIEMLRNNQDIVEYWIQNRQIQGVKDVIEEKKVFKDIWCYSNWISKPKVTGNRVLRVEIFFTALTIIPLQELVQAQMGFLQQENIKIIVKRTGNE